MNKVLCIFPQEQTTSFLQPVYDMLVRMGAVGFNHNTVESDEDLQSMLHTQINETDIVIVLCHGCSTCLYGTQSELGFDGNELLSGNDLSLLNGKRLILFSCNSTELAKRYKYSSSVVFGLIPSTVYEIQNTDFHHLAMKELDESEVCLIQQSLVRVWLRTLSRVGTSDLRQFSETFRLYIDVEIVDILIKHPTKQFRAIADILFYIKEDMDYLD